MCTLKLYFCKTYLVSPKSNKYGSHNCQKSILGKMVSIEILVHYNYLLAEEWSPTFFGQ